MRLLKKYRLEFILVIFMSFFIFAGYYVGLSVILSTGNVNLSRFYSLPIRLLMFIVAVLYLLQSRSKNIKIRLVDILMFLFFFFFTLKAIYTETIVNKVELKFEWYEYISYFLFFNYSVFIFFRNLHVRKYLNLIINTLLFSGFLLGIIIIGFYRDILFASQVGRFGASVEGSQGDILSPLAVAYSGALNVSLLVPYLINNFKSANLLQKIYYLSNFLLSMFLFIMGSTRGAFIVVVISILIYVISQYGVRKLKYIFYILPLIPLFFMYLEYTGSSLLNRLSISLENQDSSGRDVLWSDALNEFSSNPFFGGKIEVSGVYPHNIILEILMSMGIAGILLFVSLILLSFIKLNQRTIYIYIIFINGFFQYMFSGAIYTAIILFFSIGLLNGFKINSEA